MKLCNINVNGQTHLGVYGVNGIVDATAAGIPLTMDEVIAGADRACLAALESDPAAAAVENAVFANVVDQPGKLICVGLNYRAHADGLNDTAHFKTADCPILFSKYNDALVPSGAEVELPPWEVSYDYEAELVIVMGKEAWGVSEEEALDCVFGYTCGNDFSCRDPQMRSGQWLIGKTMPGFGPCGPYIVTKDEYDIKKGHSVKSYVNGQLRQDGTTADMIFSAAKIISYASRYVKLCPGDLIFTGTPSGVALEKGESVRKWLIPGDRVDVELEGIGTLTNYMV